MEIRHELNSMVKGDRGMIGREFLGYMTFYIKLDCEEGTDYLRTFFEITKLPAENDLLKVLSDLEQDYEGTGVKASFCTKEEYEAEVDEEVVYKVK